MWILPIPSTLTKEMRYCFGTFEASPESLQIRDEQRWYIKAAAYCTFLPLCHCLFWFAGVTDGSCSRFNSSLFCFCLNFSKINGRVNGWCRCRFTIRRCNFGRCSGDGFPSTAFSAWDSTAIDCVTMLVSAGFDSSDLVLVDCVEELWSLSPAILMPLIRQNSYI